MKRFILLLLLFIAIQVSAQDRIFRQIANSPLTLNPANTGLISSDWRFAGVYRSDWNSLTVPFITTSLSFDMNLFKGKMNGNSLGVGIIRTDRRAGDGNLNIYQTGLSLAYHKRLNKNLKRPSLLSVGIQSLLVQKQGNVHSFWPNPSGEFKIDPYLDLNAGIMYTGYLSNRSSLFAGVSVFHFNEQREVIFGRVYYRLARFSGALGGAYNFSKRLTIHYNGIYEQQVDDHLLQFGGALAYNLWPKAKNRLMPVKGYFGIWYGDTKVLSPYLGVELNKFRLGFSFDINTERKPLGASGGSGIELSLCYGGNIRKGQTLKSNVPIPRF